jgi:hypothetical protein
MADQPNFMTIIEEKKLKKGKKNVGTPAKVPAATAEKGQEALDFTSEKDKKAAAKRAALNKKKRDKKKAKKADARSANAYTVEDVHDEAEGEYEPPEDLPNFDTVEKTRAEKTRAEPLETTLSKLNVNDNAVDLTGIGAGVRDGDRTPTQANYPPGLLPLPPAYPPFTTTSPLQIPTSPVIYPPTMMDSPPPAPTTATFPPIPPFAEMPFRDILTTVAARVLDEADLRRPRVPPPRPANHPHPRRRPTRPIWNATRLVANTAAPEAVGVTLGIDWHDSAPQPGDAPKVAVAKQNIINEIERCLITDFARPAERRVAMNRLQHRLLRWKDVHIARTGLRGNLNRGS